MHRIVKSVNLMANAIHYEMNRDKMNVFTYDPDRKHKDMLALKTVLKLGIGKPITQLRIGQTSFNFTWNDYTIECLPVYPNVTQTAITNHIRDLFRTLPEVDLEFSPVSVALKLFPEIENVTDSCLGKVSIDTDIIEEFISLYPNQKSITIEGEVEGRLQQNSAFHQVENLFLHNSRHTAPTVFENFTGRCLFLHGALWDKPTTPSIVSFMKQWISGEKHQNLDFLMMNLQPFSEHFFDQIPVLEEFEAVTKEWDGITRPEHFKYRARLFEYHRKEYVQLNCETFLDVQRQTDGVWASFFCPDRQFGFVVWNNRTRFGMTSLFGTS